MNRIAVFAVAFFAIITAARADELDDASAACAPHALKAVGIASQQRLWEPGWEHCQPIRAAKAQRDKARDETDEAKNPDLKRTRDLAKKLTDGGAK